MCNMYTYVFMYIYIYIMSIQFFYTSAHNPASLASLCWGNAVPGPCKSFGNTFSKSMGGKGMKLFVMDRFR